MRKELLDSINNKPTEMNKIENCGTEKNGAHSNKHCLGEK